MSTNRETIERLVLQVVPEDRPPTEQELDERVNQFAQIFPISDDERIAIVHSLHARLAIRMEPGTAIVEQNYMPWLDARKPIIDPFYWGRYEQYLLRFGWTPQVTRSLERSTDELLDLFGDPEQGGKWRRRGLVMGEVQSGKTATYTGLCCKAADAGYRLIVLLTGTLENLRRQTQERLDAGFIGLDSSGFLSPQRQRREIGVGLIDPRRTGVVFTSRLKDFNTALVNQLNFRVATFGEPILLVVKKNKRVLENLERWLRAFNADLDGYIDTPLLLIDDEADNASVNTSSPDADPTAINERIRALLRLFRRSTYVGFTATPFANIFIDADSATDMLGDDLFPRDFIYALQPPTNYIGPETIFGPDENNGTLERITDAQGMFPQTHKSSHIVNGLPPSLLDAVHCFLVANAIRDLRGELKTHKSMLVNVSRFTNVQHQVARLIDEHLHSVQRDIQNYSQLEPSEALRNDRVKALKKIYDDEYSNAGFDWGAVQKALLGAALPVRVAEVNQSTGAASLDYGPFAADGLRVIAVGGNSLSRGLTLNGLCVSYFFRNSQMYDTLMQMGRWFGYRDGYADLCRIWLTDDACHWYAHISGATDELRQEIRRMRQLGMTPKDFGLKVREHPDSLIVTARNKMRAAKVVDRLVSMSEQSLETPRLWRTERIIGENANAIRTFLQRAEQDGRSREISPWGNNFWGKVPAALVAEVLQAFQPHPLNIAFQGKAIADFIMRANIDCLKFWDIVLPHGSEPDQEVVPGLIYKLQKRIVSTPSAQELLVSGRSARVASRGVEREGISKSIVKELDSGYLSSHPTQTSVPDRVYREVRERPLLLVHGIVPYVSKSDKPDEGALSVKLDLGAEALFALGLSFPKFEDRDAQKTVSYRVNTVEWKNWFDTEVGNDTDADDEAD
jgi:hypothetical protein